jgi:hypothetical protein
MLSNETWAKIWQFQRKHEISRSWSVILEVIERQKPSHAAATLIPTINKPLFAALLNTY